jgi:hypothetical protein
VSGSDWPKQSESLTCGSRSTVSVDRSMVNIDRATVGRTRAGYGPGWAGLGRAGPDTCRLLVVPRRALDLKTGSGPWSLAHGGLTAMVYGLMRSPW